MAEPKTKKSRASVAAFLAAVPDPERRKDARAVAALLRRVTGERAVLWGTNIVGYGTYHYRYASGREGDWPVVAFSPRADRISLYLSCDLSSHRWLLARLGKHAKGKGCLHLRRLSDADPAVLEELVRSGIAEGRARHRD